MLNSYPVPSGQLDFISKHPLPLGDLAMSDLGHEILVEMLVWPIKPCVTSTVSFSINWLKRTPKAYKG